jgi:hypothetical protein
MKKKLKKPSIKTVNHKDGGMSFFAEGGEFDFVGGPINPSWPKPTATDSLNLYNNTVKVLNYYRSKNYKEPYSPSYNLDNVFQDLNNAKKMFDSENKSKSIMYPTTSGKAGIGSIPTSIYYKKLSPYQFKQRETANSILDTRAPMSMYDLRINPTAGYFFNNINAKDFLHGDGVSINDYDPIAIKPDKLLTSAERKLKEQRYGKPKVNRRLTKEKNKPKEKIFTEVPTPLNPNYKPAESFLTTSYNNMINGTLPEVKENSKVTPGKQAIWYRYDGPGKIHTNIGKYGSSYMTESEFEDYIKNNPNYNYNPAPNSIGYIYKPGKGVVKFAKGGELPKYQIKGQVSGPPQLYPTPSLAFQNAAKKYVEQEDVKPTTRQKEVESVKKKKVIATAKPTFDNKYFTDTTQPNFPTGYTAEEQKYFIDNKIPTGQWAETKTKLDNQAIVERRKQIKEQASKDLADGNFTTARAEDLGNAFRFFPEDPNSFIDDYLNPFQMVGNMAGNLGSHFASDAGPFNLKKFAFDVAAPLAVGAFGSLGAKTNAQFANNILNPAAGINPFNKLGNKVKPALGSNIVIDSSEETINAELARLRERMQRREALRNLAENIIPDIETIRNVYHNRVRILTPEEAKLLTKEGIGRRGDYSSVENILMDPNVLSNRQRIQGMNSDLLGEARNRLGSDYYNQIPPGDSNINFESMDAIRNRLMSRLGRNNINIAPRAPIDLSNLTNELNENWFDDIIDEIDFTNIPSRSNIGNSQFIKNESGLTKEGMLQRIKNSDDINKISNMSDEEFKNTVLKPDGSVSTYEINKTKPEGVIDLSADEYVDEFNSNLHVLNDIIARNNKTGVEYLATKLHPDGRLAFYTPPQTLADGTVIRGGDQYWNVAIKPGKWKGEVEDVMNLDYYKNMPGLNMTDTTGSVFADGRPRTGSKTYESLNEYLKQFEMGRIKPGFNSQSDYSFPLWEKAMNKGKAYGYFNRSNYDSNRLFGAFRMAAPIGGIGAAMYNYYNPLTTSQQEFGGTQLSNRRFEEGGEYELSQEEIDRLKSQGYDIELL